ncbi:hypothetical protein ABZ793_06775 [Micromonospora sp. NPDC047465]|uniref:hypothetical protein n=1 Tax=Micromonospora sp. NPDC047465 TaxID=3154813 RepID=UPI0033ED1277
MPFVAPADPFWSVTLRSLRELTRLAVAALVLAVGLGGVTAAPAPPAPALGPAAAGAPAAVGVPVEQPLPGRAPAAERVVDAATPPAVRRAVVPAETSVEAIVRRDVPARDPGRGVPARRGPPTA